MEALTWQVEAMEAELAAELEREAHVRDAARRRRAEGEEPDQAQEDGGDPLMEDDALVSAQAQVAGSRAAAAAPASQRCARAAGWVYPFVPWCRGWKQHAREGHPFR
jgi:hypothetical protein